MDVRDRISGVGVPPFFLSYIELYFQPLDSDIRNDHI